MAEGKQRQAEYRERMLSAGKRQYSFWLTDEQVAEIRAYLAGDPSLLTGEQPEKISEGKTVPEPPAPEKPATKRSGRVTSRPGQQAHEVEVWRGEKQLGSLYKRTKPKGHWEVYRYGHILPLGKYRTKREAVAALTDKKMAPP